MYDINCGDGSFSVSCSSHQARNLGQNAQIGGSPSNPKAFHVSILHPQHGHCVWFAPPAEQHNPIRTRQNPNPGPPLWDTPTVRHERRLNFKQMNASERYMCIRPSSNEPPSSNLGHNPEIIRRIGVFLALLLRQMAYCG